MEQIFEYIDSLSSFQQGLLGSAVFAFSSWLIQKLSKKAKSSGLSFFESYSRLDVLRHVVHKHYINSNNIHEVSYGSSLVLLRAFEWIIRAFLILIFFFGIHSLVNEQWLFVAASWFSFNCALEGFNWVKDSSSVKSISYIDEDKREQLVNDFLPESKRPESQNS
ncbi:V3/V1b-type arginine vasotocin receptor [Vibrio fluvialis]|nr:V3/V1b-type arginine vasotocin receptor [Vibrio fluvialis]